VEVLVKMLPVPPVQQIEVMVALVLMAPVDMVVPASLFLNTNTNKIIK
jgi:hypothetical protein